MKLPPEIRLMIHELAIQDNIDAVMVTFLTGPTRQPYLGALALIHTTSIIRKESRNAMLSIAHHQRQDLCARSKERYPPTSLQKELRRHRARCHKAEKQLNWVKDMCTALEEPRSAKSSQS